MPRFLKEIIEQEGISQSQLSKDSGVSTTTINKICTKNLNGSKISGTIKGKLTKGINKNIGKESYKISDIKFD
jgi:transcriptional regulator with XRE-family HTH domain